MAVQVLNSTTAGELTCNVAIHKGSASEEKVSGITNSYASGSLAVSRADTGNMIDGDKEFGITVTFTAPEGDAVRSAISYMDGSETKELTFADGATSASAAIALKDEETVTFTNIPTGVSYTVESVDGEGGYDEVSYIYNDPEKKISADDDDTVSVTYSKAVNVDTGVSMDSVPYIVALGIAVIGLAVFFLRKRFAGRE